MPLNGLFEEKLTTTSWVDADSPRAAMSKSLLNLAYIDVVIKVYCAAKNLPPD
jgi:hypothetical protein